MCCSGLRTAQKLYDEESAKNPTFKTIYESMRAFQQLSDAC